MVKVSVGMMGSSVAGGSPSLATPAQVSAFLKVCKAHRVTELDTARVYNGGRSEELLGLVHASNDFAISTKAPAFSPGSLREDKILENCGKSLEALDVGKVDIYYLHGPDSETPFAEQCRAVDTLYKKGCFERFGVSNIGPQQVREVYDICTREGYVLPTVYQGGYNPLNRATSEKGLFPVLKELGIAFYAYSPLAGGLLAKPTQDIVKPEPGSRFAQMKVFGDIYLTEGILKALEKVQGVCDKEGVSKMEATLRWFMHHAPLGEEDALILGASSEQQVEKSLSACEKGPLPESLVEAWEELNESVKNESYQIANTK